MPRLIRQTPSYRLHAGSGQAIVRLNGQIIYLGVHGTAQSRREYDRLIGEWLANNRTLPKSVASAGYTIVELAAAYWKHAKEYFTAADDHHNGQLGGVKLMLRVVKGLYADADVKDFGPLALRAVRDAMVRQGWSRNYCNAQVNRVRRMFKWGAEHELVKAEIWHALKTVDPLKIGKTTARETEAVSTVDDEFVDAALPWMNRHVRALVELQRNTGMRPGEACSIRLADVTMSNPKLWEYRPAEHKTKSRGHQRVVYLNADAQAILKPFIGTDLSAYLFCPAMAEAERRAALHELRKTPMNQGNKPGARRQPKPRKAPGAKYNADSYRRAVARACDLADEWAKGGIVVGNKERIIPRWHPHQIRHNTATKLRAKYGLEAAQVILGHKTLTATQIYAEKNIEKAKQIMTEGA